MSIRDLMADICDALNENERCNSFVEDGVYVHHTKEVNIAIQAELLVSFDNKHLSAINPKLCSEVQYIAYVFFVSLKKYGYEVNNVTIRSANQKEISSKVA